MMIQQPISALFHAARQGAGFQKKRYDKGQTHPLSIPVGSFPSSDQFVKRSARVTFGMHASTSSNVAPQEKLSRMASQLSQHQLDAYFIPPEDEHLNEYLPDNKKRIEWLTGFSGESAPLLITPQKMHLFVDGRFHLQVDDEVDPQVVAASKLGTDGAPQVTDTLKQLSQSRTNKNPLKIGYDPFIVSPNRLKSLENNLPKDLPVQWVPISGNLVDSTWSDRPTLQVKPAFILGARITGQSTTEKLAAVRKALATQQADILPVTKLDEVAWLFNVRGNDIPYNPVVESYAMVTPDKAYWFVSPDKVPADVKTHLETTGVTVLPYNDYPSTLSALVSSGNKRVFIDKDAVTLGTLNLVKDKATLVEGMSPITLQKAQKNTTEIDQMKQANFKASRAIIRHLATFSAAVEQGKSLSEVEVRADLEDKYQQEPGFFELSFPTIPGIGSNSAIIHYSKADPNKVGQAGDFYLLDSGAQYVGGTTDTTRTTVFGTPPADKIKRYTAVLKSHIACANMRFPKDTHGAQIDAVARNPLWQEGLDFGHGTGHGVGAFLNVHEGPNRISKAGNGVTFKPGMVTSIEPGYYEKDWGGIRLENLYYVTEDTHRPGGKWLKFEPLTLVPFEKKLIDFKELTPDETTWLKTYYQKVWDTVSPTLTDVNEKNWLKDQCTLP